MRIVKPVSVATVWGRACKQWKYTGSDTYDTDPLLKELVDYPEKSLLLTDVYNMLEPKNGDIIINLYGTKRRFTIQSFGESKPDGFLESDAGRIQALKVSTDGLRDYELKWSKMDA